MLGRTGGYQSLKKAFNPFSGTKLKRGRNISNSTTYKNPDRTIRMKINLRPDQVKRLHDIGPRKHKIMRALVGEYFKTVDSMIKVGKIEEVDKTMK